MNPSNRTLFALTTTALALFAAGCMVVLFAFVPVWRASQPVVFLQWFAQNGKTIGAVMLPLEMIPLMLSLVALLKARASGNTTKWLLLANGMNFAILALFILYFLPLNAAFMDGTVPLTDVPEALRDWQFFHSIRTILSLLAVLFSSKALLILLRQKPNALPISK